MASLAPPDRSASTPRSTVARHAPALMALATLLVVVLPDAIGYMGGGGDDWYYVEAARCAAASGWCLPTTHWATRWPLIGPMAAAFAAFGVGPLQAMVVPFAYSIAAIILFVVLVERHFGPRAAMLAGIVFASVAAFAKAALQPNVDIVELAWLLAAATVASTAFQHSNARQALFAGVFLGVALQARMTGIVWLPIIATALALAAPAHRRLAVPIFAGIAIPLGIEAIYYALAAGDPFLSQHLAAAHGRIPSNALLPGVDLSQSPLFNPDFIGGWRPTMNIYLHWSVDGIVNLLADPAIGPLLAASLLLLWFQRRTLSRRTPVIVLACVAITYTGALIYGLAIDPKPRMFLPVAAIAATIIGILAVRAWDSGDRILVAVMVATLVIVGAIETGKRIDMARSAPLAAAWARENPRSVAVDDTTRRFLALDATLYALPVFPASNQPRLIALVPGSCPGAVRALRRAPGRWRVARQADFGVPGDPLALCEFSREDRAASPRH